MTREDLFQAIGMVDSSRLIRSELTMKDSSENSEKEDSFMKRKVNISRIIRNVLVAALIISTLAVTAYAVVGYVIFDTPQDMIVSVFGDQTGFDHSDGSITPFEDGTNVIIEPTFDRVPVDEKAAAELETIVSPVGQSISWEGYTLMVDANMYDPVTKCGVLTYTLENPEGVAYSLQSTGEVWFPEGEIVNFSQYGYSYIIEEKSTDTCLTASYYYQLRDKDCSDLVISLTQWAAISRTEYLQLINQTKQQLKQEVSEEEVIEYVKQLVGDAYPEMESVTSREEIIEQGYDAMTYERLGVLNDADYSSPDKITIPAESSGEISSITLGNGAVTLSPVAITIRVEKIQDFRNNCINLTRIVFKDGTEYIVKDGYTLNHVFAVADPKTEETTFMFNRIIDVNTVASVIVDGNIQLTVD